MPHIGSLKAPTVADGLKTISAPCKPYTSQFRGWWRPKQMLIAILPYFVYRETLKVDQLTQKSL
jgi:hypothetical protein